MFEAGKLSEESMDDFLAELDGSNALHEVCFRFQVQYYMGERLSVRRA